MKIEKTISIENILKYKVITIPDIYRFDMNKVNTEDLGIVNCVIDFADNSPKFREDENRFIIGSNCSTILFLLMALKSKNIDIPFVGYSNGYGLKLEDDEMTFNTLFEINKDNIIEKTKYLSVENILRKTIKLNQIDSILHI